MPSVYDKSVDFEAVVQCHVAAVAGACMALAMKMAGSCNSAAENLIRHYLLLFIEAKRKCAS